MVERGNLESIPGEPKSKLFQDLVDFYFSKAGSNPYALISELQAVTGMTPRGKNINGLEETRKRTHDELQEFTKLIGRFDVADRNKFGGLPDCIIKLLAAIEDNNWPEFIRLAPRLHAFMDGAKTVLSITKEDNRVEE